MEKYISKSAVNAEIKRLLKSAEAYLKYHHDINNKSVYAFRQQQLVMCELLTFISSLEVKEVDLEKEIEKCMNRLNMLAVGRKDFTNIAKHFFELGLSASNPITAADKLKAQKGEEV